MVLAAAFRRRALSLAKNCSIGLRSRAIACGNFGFESCVRERGWIPKLRARPDFDSDVAPVRRKLATCDSPALRGRVGEGGRSGAQRTRDNRTPTPNPSPQGGGERTECAAL